MMAPTLDGVLLGTAPYMSPEQARGKAVDKRADIWAFGCVLYEMLTGRRAFTGETTTDVLAKIVEREPDWSALPQAVPPHLVRLMKRCLEKDPKHRLRDIGDVSADLLASSATTDVAAEPGSPARPNVLPWTLAGALLASAALGAWIIGVSRSVPAPPPWAAEPSTVSIETTATPSGGPAALPTPGIAVSRDGRFVAWVAGTVDGRPMIWTYSVSTGEKRQLAGTEGALLPFWSPDSRSIGFFTQTALKVIDLANGSIRSLGQLPEVSGGATWGPQNVIVFSARYAIYQIPAAGGTARVVAELDRGHQENSLRLPRFLPDGRHFLYVARSGRAQQSGAYVGSLDAKLIRLFATTSHVEYSPPGYLLYVNEGALVARTFDALTFKVGAEPLTVANAVGANANGMNGQFSVSDNGVLAYFRTSNVESAVLRWFDRAGRPLEAMSAAAEYQNFRIAPDGVHVATDLATQAAVGRDVWVLNPGGAAPTRVTFGGSDDWIPFWSPDGQKVAFMSYRNGVGDIFVKTLTGAAPEQPLLVSEEQKNPGDWSADGKFVAYWSDRTNAGGDVWVMPLEGTRQPIPIATTRFNERRPRFSPDGRFVAYQSDEGGVGEIYVQPFPPTGGKWQASVGGGAEPSWRGDGRELFYINSSGMLVGVPVTLASNSFSTGAPVPLFSVRRRGASGGISRYDVTRDGNRFLVRMPVDAEPQPITLVLNWPARIKK
jgi:Tol biopolymer transport system component